MTVSEYISSGILELYVMGNLSADEALGVEKMMVLHPEIRDEVTAIEIALEQYGQSNAVQPHATIKPLLLATIDYMQRLGSGEAPVAAPIMNASSTSADFAQWISRSDFQKPEAVEDIHVKLISANAEATTAIVWIRHMAPDEVHHDEHEKFLILEGTCDIIVDGKIHSLVPGDYFQIPLHSDHRVVVTSEVACKVVLQRVAA